MSWAARREATREEDLAYALLGIFGINMTMQYGEGEKAFLRLQQEITRSTDDMSIFAWGFDAKPIERAYIQQDILLQTQPNVSNIKTSHTSATETDNGLYAARPSDFIGMQDIMHLPQHVGTSGIEERRGSQIISTLMMIYYNQDYIQSRQTLQGADWVLVILPCMLSTEPHSLVGILLGKWQALSQRTTRCAFTSNVYSCLVRSDYLDQAEPYTLEVDTKERKSLLETSLHSARLNYTVVVKYDGLDIYSVAMCDPLAWEQDHKDPGRFVSRALPNSSNTILRFHIEGAPLAVFISIDLFSNIAHTVRAMPASIPQAEVVDQIRDGTRAVGPRRCRDRCGHDQLYMAIKQQNFFNQVLTTVVAIVRRANSSFIPSVKLSGGVRLDENLAVCLKREEWLGKPWPRS